VGVLRAYQTRHGAGPLPTYSSELTRVYGPSRGHNGPNPWQGAMRVGHFDAVLARYALSVLAGPDGGAGVDQLAVTCLDEVDCAPSWLGCHGYRLGGGHVVRLRPIRADGDELIRRQERLGRELAEAEPVYEDVRDGNKAAQWIEARLGVPVGLTSHGPTHEDKETTMEVTA
jgi:adenylosuccinate synthase